MDLADPVFTWIEQPGHSAVLSQLESGFILMHSDGTRIGLACQISCALPGDSADNCAGRDTMPIYMQLQGNFGHGNGLLNFALPNNPYQLERDFKGKVTFKSINKATIDWGDGLTNTRGSVGLPAVQGSLLLPAVRKAAVQKVAVRKAADDWTQNKQNVEIIAVLIGLLKPYMAQGGGVWISGISITRNDLSRFFCLGGVYVHQLQGNLSAFGDGSV